MSAKIHSNGIQYAALLLIGVTTESVSLKTITFKSDGFKIENWVVLPPSSCLLLSQAALTGKQK